MAAVEQDITAEQGAALAVTFTGATASLQNRTLRMHVRAKVGDTLTKLVASTSDARMAVGANPYTTATLAIGSDVMAAVSVTKAVEYWVYDVESYTTAADVRREWSGTFTITREATRDTEADVEDELAGLVRYDTPQSLTTAQKLEARTNIGAGTGGGTSDHGALTGLADDDHTQYALADGTRGTFEAAGAVAAHAAELDPHPTYTTAAEAAAAAPVQSVDGQTGAVVLGSGLITEGPLLSINGGDAALFDVAAGSAYIAGNLVAWGASAGVTVTNLATSSLTHVFISAAGAIVQQTTSPTAQQRRARVYLGQLGHSDNAAIATAINAPDVYADAGAQYRDLLRCIGVFSCSGNVPGANGANLSIDISAGELIGSGINWENDADSPNNKSFSAAVAPSIRRRTQTGEGSSSTFIDPENYDSAGTVTAVPTNRWQTQRIFRLVSGNIVVQYGQAVYTTLSAALAAIDTEPFVTIANVSTVGALVGYLTVKQGATTLNNAAQAQFYLSLRIAGSGVSLPTWGAITGTLADQTDLQSALDAKQATLVSGTNIKTINSTSLLGSGDIAISATPAGAATELQYRNGGAFGAMSGTAWDDTNRALTVTGATVTTSKPVLNLSQTWNDAGVTFTGVKLNVTSTASAAASKVLAVSIGGVENLAITRDRTTLKSTDYPFIGELEAGSVAGSGGRLDFRITGGGVNERVFTVRDYTTNIGAYICSVGALGWTSTNSAGAPDLYLWRDAANTLSQRNGTTAQTFRVYNTYTDASNYERLSFGWASDVAILDVAKAGTGAARNFSLRVTGIEVLSVTGATGQITLQHSTGLDCNFLPIKKDVHANFSSSSTPLTLQPSDFGTCYLLTNASDQTWTLPASPTAGSWIMIAESGKSGSYIRINAGTGRLITVPGGTTATAGYIRSNSTRAVVKLRVIGGEYFAEFIYGTWTIDS